MKTKLYKDQDGIIRRTTADSIIFGKDNDPIQVGDTVLYVNNPSCKPSVVVDFNEDEITCNDGKGSVAGTKLIRKRTTAINIVRTPFN
jgi:hypothetical protein